MSRVSTLLVIVALLCATGLCLAGSNRLLVGPPPDYKATVINGVEYMSGEVYLPQFADTAALTALGFQGFEFLGRSVRYVRVRATWPSATDYDALPEQVMGFKYDTDADKKVEYYERPAYAGYPQTLVRRYSYNNSNVYNGPVKQTWNYNYGGGCYGHSSADRFNPGAYHYKTNSPTKLTPTTIGSHPRNRNLRRNSTTYPYDPYHYR